MLARRLGEESVRGFPPARTLAERKDTQLAPLLGFAHDDSRGRSGCPCALCVFNRAESKQVADGVCSAVGSGVRVMVADAKECGEGVSFFGVRRLLLADVPPTSEDLMQRVGRAVRFMGHAALPPEERQVEVRLYVATHKHGETADEVTTERLREDCGSYAPELARLKAKAVDAGMWVEEVSVDAAEQEAGADDELAEAMAELALSAEHPLSESEGTRRSGAEGGRAAAVLPIFGLTNHSTR